MVGGCKYSYESVLNCNKINVVFIFFFLLFEGYSRKYGYR